MTEKEINKIAKKFELDMFPTMPDMLSAKAMLEYLSKDFYIVPKNEVKELVTRDVQYQGYKSLTKNFPEDLIPERIDWEDVRDYADGLYYLLCNLLCLLDKDLD